MVRQSSLGIYLEVGKVRPENFHLEGWGVSARAVAGVGPPGGLVSER